MMHYGSHELNLSPQLASVVAYSNAAVGAVISNLGGFEEADDDSISITIGRGSLADDYDDKELIGSNLAQSQQQSQSKGCVLAPELECSMYFYVRYWKERFKPADCFRSPAAHPLGQRAPVKERKYVLFQPDLGGWNNIRMAAETVMVFAHASGRTLVMPPRYQMYLLDGDPDMEDNLSSFDNFMHMHGLSEVLDIIPMEQFIREVAKPGLLSEPWSDSYAKSSRALWQYFEKSTYVRDWEPGKYHIGFNLSSSPDKIVDFGTFMTKKEDKRQRLHGSHNRKLVAYDAEMHSHRVIFFPGDHRSKYRILTHFYSYLYFAHHPTEHAYKRMVRDRIRYNDEIFCAAGRLVRLIHEEAAALARRSGDKGRQEVPDEKSGANSITHGGDTAFGATYYSYHIRRGDFQYHSTRLSGASIWNNTRHMLFPEVSRLIYIASDDKNRNEFAAFKGGTDKATLHPRFKVRFLTDYIEKAQLGHEHLSPNQWGMVEQIVCANAHTFFGTPLSTFTGYITRMRGYYRDDRYLNTFYHIPSSMYTLHRQKELKGPFWAREFAVAHADIDDDSASSSSRRDEERARQKAVTMGWHRRNNQHSHELLKNHGKDLDQLVRDSMKMPNKGRNV
jgi:hypothetical protein